MGSTRRRICSIHLTLLLAGLAGCQAACPFAGQRRMTRVELFFGRDRPGGGEVTAPEWRDFAARVLTPAFPDGFTAFDAEGQWRNPATLAIAREPTYVVLVGSRVSQSQIDGVVSAYRKRFSQLSVGVLSEEACGAF